jgi:hypothetical protein
MFKHCPQRQIGRETNDTVHEIVALKPDGWIAIPGGKTRVREKPLQLMRSFRDVFLGINIAPDGNVDVRHTLMATDRPVYVQ